MNTPPDMAITLTRQPDAEDVQRLDQAFREFETAHFPGLADPSLDLRFHVFARDRNGELTGGLRGAVYWDGLEVEVLWVDPATRGRGIGTALLQAAEAFATENDAVISHLKTVLARDFYERHGAQAAELTAELEANRSEVARLYERWEELEAIEAGNG